jgi:glucokinase
MASANDLYPWLVADIGGTNARFGLVRGPDAEVHDIVALRCADYGSPQEAAQQYLQQIGTQLGEPPQPQLAAFAVATPIDGDTIKLTNNSWVVVRPQVERALGVRRLHLFNDFEVLALALPHLKNEDVEFFGGGVFDRQLPMTVIGPGTGLGVAACVPTGRGWVALASEGGHVTACATDDFEWNVLNLIRLEYPHISAERVLSGIGLPLLHRAVSAVRGVTVEDLPAKEISRRALDEGDPDCRATLDTFCAMLGTFAGNVALTVGARGGVFVAGGIAQKLGPFLTQSRFRERFEAKGRFRGYMASIATGLVTAAHVALSGAAHGIENELRGTPDS